GATWTTETEGLHANHCLAVAFIGDDIYVTACESPFGAEGAVYRRPVDSSGPLTPIGGGLPRWIVRSVDTANMTVRGRIAAMADGGGNLYLSRDSGRSWAKRLDGLPLASGLRFLTES